MSEQRVNKGKKQNNNPKINQGQKKYKSQEQNHEKVIKVDCNIKTEKKRDNTAFIITIIILILLLLLLSFLLLVIEIQKSENNGGNNGSNTEINEKNKSKEDKENNKDKTDDDKKDNKDNKDDKDDKKQSSEKTNSSGSNSGKTNGIGGNNVGSSGSGTSSNNGSTTKPNTGNSSSTSKPTSKPTPKPTPRPTIATVTRGSGETSNVTVSQSGTNITVRGKMLAKTPMPNQGIYTGYYVEFYFLAPATYTEAELANSYVSFPYSGTVYNDFIDGYSNGRPYFHCTQEFTTGRTVQVKVNWGIGEVTYTIKFEVTDESGNNIH